MFKTTCRLSYEKNSQAVYLKAGEEVNESMWPGHIWKNLIRDKDVELVEDEVKVDQHQPAVKNLLFDEYLKIDNKKVKSIKNKGKVKK